jgi:UDP-glucose 4-epimerase
MKIFITGGSGFIGKYLIPILVEHEILCLSHSQKIESGRVTNIKVIIGDLTKSESYIDALKRFKPDCCIHLAWYGLPDYSIENNKKNLLAGIDLIENLVDVGCKKIFAVGSCWEYGNAQGELKESDTPVVPGIFSSFKTSLQIISESICNQSNIKLLWARVFFVYGPGQRQNSLIPSCYQSLKNGEQPKVNNPLARNDFVYILDVVDSIRVLVESEVNSGIYNIGSGKSSAVWEVVNNVAAELGLPQPYKGMPITTDGNWADMSKVKKHGWVPKFSLESGISNTIKVLEGDL